MNGSEIVKKIQMGPTFKDWGFTITYDEYFSSTTNGYVMVTMKVPDRKSGLLTPVSVSEHVSLSSGVPDQVLIDVVRRLVKRLLDHEIDENLLVDGKRVFDPHKPSPPAGVRVRDAALA